jgi:hypothetical protein
MTLLASIKRRMSGKNLVKRQSFGVAPPQIPDFSADENNLRNFLRNEYRAEKFTKFCYDLNLNTHVMVLVMLIQFSDCNNATRRKEIFDHLNNVHLSFNAVQPIHLLFDPLKLYKIAAKSVLEKDELLFIEKEIIDLLMKPFTKFQARLSNRLVVVKDLQPVVESEDL